jgi:hypothetical protein
MPGAREHDHIPGVKAARQDLLLHGAGRYRLAWHRPVASARPAGVRLACTGSGSWTRQAGTGSVCGPGQVASPGVPVIGGRGWSPQSPLDEVEQPGWCRRQLTPGLVRRRRQCSAAADRAGCPQWLTGQRPTLPVDPLGGRGVDAADEAGPGAAFDAADTQARGAGRGAARRRSRSPRCRGTGRRTRPRSAAALLVPGGTAGRPRSRAGSPGCRPACPATRRC